jgi:putative glutamine amidotransferase
MARPVVGITTYVTQAQWGYWDVEAALVPAAYVRAIERAGGRPLLVPPSEDGVEETLGAVDGLLFSGGSDLDPELYDQEPHDATCPCWPCAAAARC